MHLGNGFSTTCVLNDESIQLFEDVFGTSLDMNRSILVEDFCLYMFPEGAILNTHPSLEVKIVKIKVCFRVCLTTCHSFFTYLHILHMSRVSSSEFMPHVFFFSKAQQWHHATLVSFVVASLVVFHNST